LGRSKELRKEGTTERKKERASEERNKRDKEPT